MSGGLWLLQPVRPSRRRAPGIQASRSSACDRASKSGIGCWCDSILHGAAWRSPKARDMAPVIEMIKGVKALGMETCMTLGMLSAEQACQLAEAGLEYSNHNIDTSERFYEEIVTTPSFPDRLNTHRHL